MSSNNQQITKKFEFPKYEITQRTVKYQKFAVLILFHHNGEVKYYSIGYCCKNQESAITAAKEIFEKIGKDYPISIQVVQIGYWNAINTNFKELIQGNSDSQVANLSLNDFMKNYLDELESESDKQKKRKDEALKSAEEEDGKKVVTNKFYDANIGIEESKLNIPLEKDGFVNNESSGSNLSQILLNNSQQGLNNDSQELSSDSHQKLPQGLSSNLPSDTPFVNYLTVDKLIEYPITGAKHYVVQFLTSNDFPIEVREKYVHQKYVGIKIKCFFDDYEDAKTKAEYFNKKDKYFNTPVCDLFEWYPFGFDIENVKSIEGIVYQEQALNEFMQPVREQELKDVKKNIVNNSKLEDDDDENNEENNVRNLLAENNDDYVEKPSEEDILEEKLAEIQRKKEITKRKLLGYDESSQILDEKLDEIKSLFSALQK